MKLRPKYLDVGFNDTNPAFSSEPPTIGTTLRTNGMDLMGEWGFGGNSKRRDIVLPGKYQPVKRQQWTPKRVSRVC
jgi:hypothetical protein